MSRTPLIAIVVLLPMTVGCAEKAIPPEESYNPEEVQGTVDSSLPRAVQAKQEALQRILVSLHEGIEVDALSGYHSDLQFQETLDEFLEGTINLARWDFNGTPTDNDVPVVLYLSVDSSGGNERRVERVYTVTGSPGRLTIRRKP